MTDNAVTDDDLRNARLWAEKVGPPSVSPGYIGTPSEIHSAARVILANVDAPEPTLTERLREQFHYPEQNDEQHGIILDAAQMEHDLAEARAEAILWEGKYEEMRESEQSLGLDLADAHAEMERLTDVQKQLADVQKGAESSAETPDPADVPPGEAWLVECAGEKRNAVKDEDDSTPWNTVNTGGRLSCVRNEDVTLITRLVPAPRVITDPKELDALSEGTIIRAKDGEACRKSDIGDWSVDGLDGAVGYGPRQVLPATVLWEPEA